MLGDRECFVAKPSLGAVEPTCRHNTNQMDAIGDRQPNWQVIVLVPPLQQPSCHSQKNKRKLSRAKDLRPLPNFDNLGSVQNGSHTGQHAAPNQERLDTSVFHL